MSLVSCASQGEARVGNALSGDGTQSSGVVGTDHAKVGQIWWFAFPVVHNTSDNPISITGVSLRRVPKGIEVLKYGAYDRNDTEGLPLLALEGDSAGPNFAKLKDYARRSVVVAGGTESDIFYVVKLRILAPPVQSARYCRFSYKQGGQTYTQEIDCEVHLKTD
ncbi:hypothetical protein ACFVDT_13055 [Streptomyces sp. NPDC057699]|uniref:hypothetical protein n=1 Tax=Streptomyces sp. NPDC057699 TaxID=3346220 RepID=UPI0036C2B17B